MTKTIIINRKLATVFSFIILIVLTALSVYFFYRSTYGYFTKLEQKLAETTKAYNEVRYLESEAALLENKRQEFLSTSHLLEEGEFVNDEVEDLIRKILEQKALEISYFYLKAININYPILFEETPVIYFVSYKTGDE